jgi:hypothetical protein
MKVRGGKSRQSAKQSGFAQLPHEICTGRTLRSSVRAAQSCVVKPLRKITTAADNVTRPWQERRRAA